MKILSSVAANKVDFAFLQCSKRSICRDQFSLLFTYCNAMRKHFRLRPSSCALKLKSNGQAIICCVSSRISLQHLSDYRDISKKIEGDDCKGWLRVSQPKGSPPFYGTHLPLKNADKQSWIQFYLRWNISSFLITSSVLITIMFILLVKWRDR